MLEIALEGKEWLVGEKMTFADLSFTLWNERINDLMACKPEEKFEGFPNVKMWHERMTAREAWKTIMEKRVKLMDEQRLQPNGIPKGVESSEEYRAVIKAHAEKMAQK